MFLFFLLVFVIFLAFDADLIVFAFILTLFIEFLLILVYLEKFLHSEAFSHRRWQIAKRIAKKE